MMTTQHPPIYEIPEDNCPPDCYMHGDLNAVHFHGDAGWKAYKASLTPEQWAELQRRSRKYQQSLTASAMMTGFLG